MRNVIAFALSLFLSLNAAHAAVVGVCDALEQAVANGVAAEHGAHFGHHSHHDQGADVVSGATPDAFGKAGGSDQKSPTIVPSDHFHAHPSFSSLLPGGVIVPAVPRHEAMIATPANAYVSAHPSRLERPPRASLA